MMLSMGEFNNTVKRDLAGFLPADMAENAVIDHVEVVKINDQKLHGITIRESGENAAMTFYLDDMFERYESGEDIGIIMTELAAAYEQNRYAVRPPEVDLSWEELKDDLTVRVVEKQRNREFLRERPYVDVGNGLAVICDISMGEDRGGDWRVGVTRSVLEAMGTDAETLFSVAMERAVINDPPVLTDMSQAMFSPDKVNLLNQDGRIAPGDIGAMYVLTNESGSFGAAALFYPNVKEKAAELLGSGYYVLPSSSHEVILVPETAGIAEKELCDMVKQANRTVVDEKDILSDNVLRYDMVDRRLEKVSGEPERGDRVAEAR